MKKTGFPRFFAAVLLILLGSSCKSGAECRRETIFAFDTYMTFTVYGDKADEAISAAKERISALEKLWSPTDPESEIFRINHRTESTVTLSAETSGLLRTMLDVSEMTGGALDPTLFPLEKEWGFISGEYRVPGKERIAALLENTGYENITLDGDRLTLPDGFELDVGAAAKGKAADIIADCFSGIGVKSAVIDLGGNILTVGEKPDGGKWSIGIRSPYGDGTSGTVKCVGRSVVTSGNYERFFVEDGKRYHHILDPKTGFPAENGIISMTVIGAESVICDSLSTALFVMGTDKACAFLAGNDDTDAVFVTSDGIIYITAGIKDTFTYTGDGNAEIRIIEGK